MTMFYRFDAAFTPAQRMRVKIEINTREHFSVLGLEDRTFSVATRWFSGSAAINVYRIDELLGTKLRALYQRKRGRDLYDLWRALESGIADSSRVVHCFLRYMEAGGLAVSRAEFEGNLADKMQDEAFVEDLRPLLPADVAYEPDSAASLVRNEIISKIPGAPWKGAAP